MRPLTASCLSMVVLALSVSAAWAQQPRAASAPPVSTERSQFLQKATEASADVLIQSQAARALLEKLPSITIPPMTLPADTPPVPDALRSPPAPLRSRPGS